MPLPGSMSCGGRQPISKSSWADLLFPDPGLIDPPERLPTALLELFGDQIDSSEGLCRKPLQLAPFQRDGFTRGAEDR